jgi:type VI secretion system secreted protein Hcp
LPPAGQGSSGVPNVEYLVEFAGINNTGPQDKEHPNAFPLMSFSQVVANPHDPVLGPMGKADVSDVTLVKLVDGASTTLFKSATTNMKIDKVTIYCRAAGGKQKDFYVIELKDVVVTAMTVTGSEQHPMERVSLGFAEIKYSYSDQSNKGDLNSGMDVSYEHGDNK